MVLAVLIHLLWFKKNQHKSDVPVCIYGVKLWNTLSDNLKDCNSVIIQEILYLNLLVTVLVYSATIPCFHMFATLLQ